MSRIKRSKNSIFFSAFMILMYFGTIYLSQTVDANAITASSYVATTLDGKVVSLEDLRGQVALVNVWATWCEPCRAEMPVLQNLQQKFVAKNFVVIGVSIDDMGTRNRIKDFLQSEGITYSIWLDPNNRFESAFRTIGTPESFLIGRDGNILYHWRGPIDPTTDDVEARITNALADIPQPEALYNTQSIGLAIAFVAGLLSFFSPCVLPLIPAYVTFITGLSLKELSDENTLGENFGHGSTPNQRGKLKVHRTVITKGGLFVLGFSIVFISLGTSVALVGSVFNDSVSWITKIGGIVIILFGLHILGLLRIPRLERQMKMNVLKNPKRAGALFVGMTFGAGWTPCIGPILAGILTLAATTSSVSTGAMLLGVYSAGLAIPFIISAIAIDRFLIFTKKIRRWIPWIERTSGILLLVIGILLITGFFTTLSSIFGISIIPEIPK